MLVLLDKSYSTHFPAKVGCLLNRVPQTFILRKNFNLKNNFKDQSFLLSPRLIVNRQGRLAVKWTAYEALMFNTYTTKSDE